METSERERGGGAKRERGLFTKSSDKDIRNSFFDSSSPNFASQMHKFETVSIKNHINTTMQICSPTSEAGALDREAGSSVIFPSKGEFICSRTTSTSQTASLSCQF